MMMATMGGIVRRWRTICTTGATALAVVLMSFVFADAAPAAPEITSPTQGSMQPGGVAVRGRAATGTRVEIFEGAVSLGAVDTSNTGTWTKVVPLTQGAHTVFAVARPKDGGADVSPPSGSVTFEVDATKPGVGIAAPEPNAVVPPGDGLTIAGSATDNRDLFAIKLEYWSLGRLQLRALAECPCDGTSSEWSHSPNLVPGYYTVIAFAYDAAGNQSPSVARPFVLASAGALPVPVPPVPGAPPTPTIQIPPSGSTQPGADKPIPIGGRGSPGSNVRITERSLGPIGTVRTDSRGYWQYQTWLPTGRYTITAQAFDARGRLSAPAKLLSFQVDADRPTVGFLTQDNTVFMPLQPIRIEGRIFDNRRVAAVRLDYWLLDHVVGREWARCVGCSTTDALWSATPNLPYPGTYVVVARGLDAAGNNAWTTEITIVKLA